jgi:hypothetical protein
MVWMMGVAAGVAQPASKKLAIMIILRVVNTYLRIFYLLI